MRLAIDILLWFSAISAGLMAGLYFAFSTFIMTALAGIERTAGVATINAINRVILRSAFMPVFLGSSVASLALVALGLLRRDDPGATAMAAGGTIYFVGMFVVTMLGNVPLNNALAVTDPTQEADAGVWAGYLRRWTRWNHVRTLSSIAALALFILAIAA
jgi:uncharacterized membrane protein